MLKNIFCRYLASIPARWSFSLKIELCRSESDYFHEIIILLFPTLGIADELKDYLIFKLFWRWQCLILLIILISG